MPRPNRRWPLPDLFLNSLSSDAGTAPAHVEAARWLMLVNKDELRSFGIGNGN